MPARIRFDVFTLLPEVFEPYIEASIIQRARQRGLVSIHVHNIRDWTYDRHHVCDDEPYGGGGGMVMKPEPIFTAVESVLGSPPSCPVILLTPQGRLFTQKVAMELAAGAAHTTGKPGNATIEPVDAPDKSVEAPDQPAEMPGDPDQAPPVPLETGLLSTLSGTEKAEEQQAEPAGPDADREEPAAVHLALLCGRYEGIDERVRQYLVTDEISIGDYVLTGGELPALILIDAVTRLIPGALGDPTGAMDDSHASGLLEYPHYTRPPEFRGWRVPEVLLSGDHARIDRWRREQSLLRTARRRSDMLERAELTQDDQKFLAQLRQDAGEE